MKKKKEQSVFVNILFLIIGILCLFLGVLLGKEAMDIWKEKKVIANYTLSPTITATPLPTATWTPTITPTITLTPTQTATPTPILPTATITPAVGVEKLGSVEQDIHYCTNDGVDLFLDVYYPQTYRAGGEAWPMAIFYHGGGWTAGSKEGPNPLIEVMRDAGFLTVSVEYRLAPDYKFPAFIEDAKCAVRYMRANAPTYFADPDKIGAFGTSAGGHIAALVGTTGNNNVFKTKEWSFVSDEVQVVVSFYGPAVMTELCESHEEGQNMVYQTYAPTSCYDDDLVLADPGHYADAGDPPTMLLHGSSDWLVPYEQSVFLHEALKTAGVPTSLGKMQGAGHAYQESKDPTPEMIELMLVDYMEKWMDLKESN